MDRGFVLSDHTDWPGLMDVIAQTGAERVLVTHGYVASVVRWLREQGLEAYNLETPFSGEEEVEEA
jgi:putative mRNA 3-end processing factor